MKQNQKWSRAKAQRRKEFIIRCGGVSGKRVLTRTMVFVSLFLLLGVGAVSANQLVPTSTASVTQPSGSPAVQSAQPTGTHTSTGSQVVRGPVTGNQAAPRSAASLHSAPGTSAGGDIRDIRGPLHIPDPLAWLIYAAAGFLLAPGFGMVPVNGSEDERRNGKNCPLRWPLSNWSGRSAS